MASTTTKKRSRKGLALGLAVLGVAGLSLASAATLGVTTTTLGAGAVAVGSCDPDGVSVSYNTTFVPGIGTAAYYRVDSVVLSGVATACDGGKVQIDLTDSTGARIGGFANATLTLTGTPATSATLTIPTTPPVKADQVFGAAVVIAK